MPMNRSAFPKRKCAVPDCCTESVAAGLCSKHYMRKWNNGSTDATRRAPGSGTITSYGYIVHGNEKTMEHRAIVERVLGHPLPPRAEVHHINGNRADNRNENLVVCPNRAYHFLLHVREKALDACGNANFRKCPFCQQYDDPQTMMHNKSSRYYYHGECKNIYRRNLKCKTKPQRHRATLV